MVDTPSPDAPSDPPRPLDPARLRQVSQAINQEYPIVATVSGVTLLDLDPFRVHAYWSLTARDRDRALEALGEQAGHGRLVLRFREVNEADGQDGTGAGPRDAFDRPLSGGGGWLEVAVWSPGACYEAELGFTAPDGGWLSLAQSNRVRLPSLSLDTREAIGLPGPAPVPRTLPSPPAPQAPTPAPQDPEPAESAFPDPSLRGDGSPLPPRFPNPRPLEDADSAARSTPTAAPERVGVSLPPEPLPPIRPAGDRPRLVTPDHPLDLSSALLGLSSASLGGQTPALELRAELHLHGRVAPGMELRLLGRRVPVGPDGRFDIRQPIAPEALLLPLLGVQVKDAEEDP